jgi:hypothetical protein
MEERRCDLPIIFDSQICNCTGTILWHNVLVLELNSEPKRTYGICCTKIFSVDHTIGPQHKRDKGREGIQEKGGRNKKEVKGNNKVGEGTT